MTPYFEDGMLTAYLGDVRDVLRELEDESVHCVVTSPPYYGLRDYGVDGQIGLEETPQAFVAELVGVFREVRRVLRKDGTLWLNLGDTYADRANRRSDGESFRADRADVVPGKRNTIGGEWRLKAKDRMGIPHRVVFALQDDGWWWRDEIIWHKPNPMPSSVGDRTTPAHEFMFMLARSRRYAYDAAAIREDATWRPQNRRQDDSARSEEAWSDLAAGDPPHTGLHRPKVHHPSGWATHEGSHGRVHREGRELEPTYTDARWPSGWASGSGRGHDPKVGRYEKPDGHERVAPDQRNRRSVWTIPPQPMPEAHFATFPEALVEPCVFAGSPKDGVVLDPFGGAGTVALVANRLGRRAIHVELNPEYMDIALRRVRAAWEVPA